MLTFTMKNQEIVIIDDVDVDLISLHKWSPLKSRSRNYVQTHIGIKTHLIHRMIMSRIMGREITTKELVDHINGNSLDNRRENLRLATQAQNLYNQGKQKNNTSGYKGVYYDQRCKRWAAAIMSAGINYKLGRFSTPEEAYAAYCAKAKELHGEFANFG